MEDVTDLERKFVLSELLYSDDFNLVYKTIDSLSNKLMNGRWLLRGWIS